MANWYTSDHHFGHKNIIRLTGRPFADLDEMHRELKDRWNSLISPTDDVYYVGDLSFMQESQNRKLLQSLNGKIHLIQGNHDKEKHLPKDLFQSIQTQLQVNIGQFEVLLCHYPYRGTPEEIKHAEENGYKVKFLERRPEDKGGVLIHGHVHEKWKVKRRMINVSVEVWDYYPVSETQILQLIHRMHSEIP